MTACIAVLNAGSSSIKFAIYDGQEALQFRGSVERIGTPEPALKVVEADGRVIASRKWRDSKLDHRRATSVILETMRDLVGGRGVTAVGHRVVHGGNYYSSPVRVDSGVIAALRSLVALAPLHQPLNIAPIEAIAEAAPKVPQVACFDTVFHRRQPPLAQMFALPRKYTDDGVRRYGFHGLSYEFVSSRLALVAPELARRRVIIAHLGNGASLCGMRDGVSVATTMGFTAADGLVMGTRCGALDPGALLYLMAVYGLSPQAVEDLIYRQSGLLGVSGISSDMRTLRASSSPAAAQAVGLFVYRAVREIGSIAAALEGIDALVFTGGIGENDPATRAEIVEGCAWLGVELDAGRNARGAGRISADASRIAGWVIPTDEERMIARHTSTVLGLCHEDA
jgi:acetate kinase